MMRNLINEGGCLASLRRLPAAVCSCLLCCGGGRCGGEPPVIKAAPDLDIMRTFLREPNLRYLQVRLSCCIHVFNRLEMVCLSSCFAPI